MKSRNKMKVLSYLLVFILFMGVITGADVPETVKVTVDKNPLYTIQYEGYDISARRIRMNGSNNVAYCLEINKKYPSGQSFIVAGNLSENINNIVAAGYPNRTVEQLNLDNENEAYFATQIAIWSGMEGYDVNKFKGENPKILEAIKTIYNDGMSGKYTNRIKSKAYKTNDESVQDIITIFPDNLIAEQKAETMQKQYPPQEG